MKKKFMMGTTAALLVGALAGGVTTAHAANGVTYTSTSTSSTTTSETDADGNITETTVMEITENGETRTATIVEWTDAQTGEKYLIDVPVVFVNDSDVDITQIYLAPSEATEWGDGLLDEDTVLGVGEQISGLTLSVNEAGCEIDLLVMDADGVDHTFEVIEMSDMTRDEVVIAFQGSADEGYVVFHSTEE